MAKIVLEVSEENLGSVVTILTSLKEGLVQNMEVSSNSKQSETTAVKKETRYQPKVKKVHYEENQEELEGMGKYVNPTEFKKRFVKK